MSKRLKMKTCQCCGYQMGYWRERCPACWANLNSVNHDVHRADWIKSGMIWSSNTVVKPLNWNPIQTLGVLALKVTTAKTKGRPPRLSP